MSEAVKVALSEAVVEAMDHIEFLAKSKINEFRAAVQRRVRAKHTDIHCVLKKVLDELIAAEGETGSVDCVEKAVRMTVEDKLSDEIFEKVRINWDGD